MLVYIDNIYRVSGGKLYKVHYKNDPKSLKKSAKYRIAAYAKVINNLSSDAYSLVLTNIAQINNMMNSVVTYQYPEVKCPECGNTIEAQEASASQLLFSRHRLNLLSAQS
jgi:phage FluMu protein Com